MVKRKKLSPAKRLAVFEAAGGVCHICEQPIRAGQTWDISHPRPLALGGTDDESNWAPAHKDCHRGEGSQTSEDIARISKAKRQKQKAVLGIRKSSKPIQSRPFARKERKPKIDFTERKQMYEAKES